MRRIGTLLKEIGSLILESVQAFSKDRAARLAAALAYYALFSLAPLLVIAIAIIGFVFGERAARNEIAHQLEELLGPDLAQFVQRIVANVADRTSGIVASIIGVGAMLLGASGLFGQLQGALNTIWHVPPKSGVKHMLNQRLTQFLMVVGISVLLLLSVFAQVIVSAVIEYLHIDSYLQPLNLAGSFLMVAVLFAAIYKWLPDTSISWGDVWIGALVTSLLFTIGRWGIGLYMARSTVGSAYGAAGSLVVLMVWIYYSAQIILLGAEFTHVYATRYGSLRPAKRGAQVPEEATDTTEEEESSDDDA